MISGIEPVFTNDTRAVEHLAQFCHQNDFKHITLVTDQNLYPILGKRAEQALKQDGISVRVIILHGDPVHPDDRYITKIFTQVDDTQTTFLSVGSGTLTDLTRFVALRTKSAFISMPTAPSMDGYASSGSALTLDGMKQTIISKPPIAIFADLDVLSHAPRAMISAGFGDVLGKFTALADWALGGLLWADAYSPELDSRTSAGLHKVVGLLPTLDANWEQAIKALTDSLVDVGICMALAGNSRPASGSEHSCSHYWEMKMMREGRPEVFHGTKVAYATTLISKLYEILRGISRAQATELLQNQQLPGAAEETRVIQQVFGPMADQVLKAQRQFLGLTQEQFLALKERVVANWDEIQAIARRVPASAEIVEMMRQAGLPTDPGLIHLTRQDIHEALAYGHYLRNPFTIVKLFRYMGVDFEQVAG